jgi:hypothetical protein
MVRHTLLLFLSLAITACAQTSVRHLPVADEMPATPAGAMATVAPADFVSFYPKAATQTDSPPELSRFGIECSESIDGVYFRGIFTLAETPDGKSALFVLTQHRVTDLLKTISFGSTFGDPNKTLDWGYVYDRNGDGWVDYVVFLYGALPWETEAIAERIPKRPGADPYKPSTMTPEEAQLQFKNARLLFIHYVDDNFDGKVDAIVSVLRDPERPSWIYRRAVLRSRAFTQEVDEDWTFATGISNRTGRVPRLQGVYDIEGLKGDRHLENASKILDVINAGIRRCRIPKGALPRG